MEIYKLYHDLDKNGPYNFRVVTDLTDDEILQQLKFTGLYAIFGYNSVGMQYYIDIEHPDVKNSKSYAIIINIITQHKRSGIIDNILK